MDKKTAIAVARNLKSTLEQFDALVGMDDDIDALLAANPAVPSVILKTLSTSAQSPARRKLASNPSTPVEALVRVGSEFPTCLFGNPMLPDLLVQDKKFPLSFEKKTLLKILAHKDCPDSFRDWALRTGSVEHQFQYLFKFERSNEINLKFCRSRHPIIVLAILERDESVYMLWANELGWEPSDKKAADSKNANSARVLIDDWVDSLSLKSGDLYRKLVPQSGCADTLQGELIRASSKIQHDYSSTGLMNWDGWFESLLKLIQSTLKSDLGFSRLAKNVIDADVAQIKACGRQGQDMGEGKEPRAAIFDSSILKGDVETSFTRLDAMIVLWCERHAEPVPYFDPDTS